MENSFGFLIGYDTPSDSDVSEDLSITRQVFFEKRGVLTSLVM